MARPHIEPHVDRDAPFRKMTLPGFPKGMHCTRPSPDTDADAGSMTVMFEPGSYLCVPVGVSMPAMKLPRGIMGLLFCTCGELPTGGGRTSRARRQ